jgi:hypothetical protein
VIPTAVPDRLRLMAQWAGERAGDPLTALDDLNPHIVREWLALAVELQQTAGELEGRFKALLDGRRTDCPGADKARECSNFACRKHGCQGG